MAKFIVMVEVMVEADHPDEALNLVEDAVNHLPQVTELIDSSVEEGD